jgi:hypothetical protein
VTLNIANSHIPLPLELVFIDLSAGAEEIVPEFVIRAQHIVNEATVEMFIA